MSGIRLCPPRWAGFNAANSLFLLRKCDFCTNEIIDRRNVEQHEPPAACQACADKYYAGKLTARKHDKQ